MCFGGKKGLCAGQHTDDLVSIVSIVLSVHCPAQENLTFHTAVTTAIPVIHHFSGGSL